MNYSILKNTVVDMTYPMIEQAAKENAAVLIPVSVVEEHGPHMCTGVDIYLTGVICEKIQKCLCETNIKAVIAPPFYWGVNSITNGFAGSFRIKQETTKQLLFEIAENFVKWGFQNIFLVSFHGDFVHMRTLADAALKMQGALKARIFYLAEQSLFSQLGYQECPECFIPVKLDPRIVNIETEYFDIHAGANETSWMLLDFPDLVDVRTAKSLEPTNIDIRNMKEWVKGGSKARQLTPQGYCGNPANIQTEKIREAEAEVVRKYTDAIINNIR